MVLLNSQSLPLGGTAKPFNLISVDGRSFSLESFSAADVLVIMFICNHCPYVQAIEDRIIALQRFFNLDKRVALVGICSNDPSDYPDDSPAQLKKRWNEKKYGFPYLIDTTQEVARAYGAVCTPDLFVFDNQRRLAYHGRLDDSWKDASKVTTEDLKKSIVALLAKHPVDTSQLPSMGCSIKWKKTS